MLDKIYKINFKKLALILIGLFLIFGFNFYLKNNSQKSINILILNKQDFLTLQNCKSDTYCFKDFYTQYAKINGREKSVKHFQELIKKDENFTENCHYIFHGIGHGTLENLKGDVAQVFSVSMLNKPYNTLPPTCGSGYFHGLIEKYVEDDEKIISKNLGEKEYFNFLLNKLIPVCKSVEEKNAENKINCFHGVGHAAFIELEENLKGAISVCEKISKDEKMQSMCRTGIFMEMLRKDKGINEEQKILTFKACENLQEKYQGECFNQQSYLLAEFATKKEEFNQNLKSCKKIKDDFERISCIRMFDF